MDRIVCCFWKLLLFYRCTPRFMKLSDRCIQTHLKTYALADSNRTSSCHILKSRLTVTHLSYCTVKYTFAFTLSCFTFFFCRTLAKGTWRNKLYILLYNEPFEFVTLKQFGLILQFYVSWGELFNFCIGHLVSDFQFQHVCYQYFVCYKQPRIGFFEKKMSLNYFFSPPSFPLSPCPSFLISAYIVLCYTPN